jgi:hypothetical protein
VLARGVGDNQAAGRSEPAKEATLGSRRSSQIPRPAAPRRTVLFLGAGASAAFGYPITSAILPRIREKLEDGTLFPVASNRRREAAKMKRLRQHLESMFPRLFEPDIELPLITDLLSLIDLMLATEEVLLPMVPAAAMQDCRTLLEQAILEVVEAEFRRPDAHKGIDRLADWILNGRDERGAPVTIVSTNYDTLIEALLFERLEMAALEVPVAVDMGFFWREHRSGTFHEAVNQPPPDPMVRLLKLHGSLNWLKCPLCGFVYINTTGSIHQQAFREGHVDYNNTCLCGHGPVRTVIVAPSMVRTIRDPDLLTIWRTALEALRTADEWILAGYSLPPEDIAIRSILLRARNGRGRQGAPPTIRVVQYKRDPGLEGRYRLLLPESIFEWDGFQAFVEGLPRGTRHFPTF